MTVLVNGKTYSRPLRVKRRSPGNRPIPSLASHGCNAVRTSSAIKVVSSHFIRSSLRSVWLLQRMQTVTVRKAEQGAANAAADEQHFDELTHFRFRDQPMDCTGMLRRVLGL